LCRKHASQDAEYRKFGASAKLAFELRNLQGNRCAICETSETELGRSYDKHPVPKELAMDHDHEKMTPRGLLCSKCNKALGSFGDDPKLLKKAAEYLENYQKIVSSGNIGVEISIIDGALALMH
jgi:hypothetical protein